MPEKDSRILLFLGLLLFSLLGSLLGPSVVIVCTD